MIIVGSTAVGLDTVTASAERDLPAIYHSYGTVAFLTSLPPVVLGALLIRARPRHAVGWALTAFGVTWLVNVIAGEWSSYGALVAPDAPGVGLADWYYSRFGAWLLPLLALVGVVFPDGRLPTDPRWRWGTVAGLAITSIAPAALMFAPFAAVVELAGERSPKHEAIAIDLLTLPLPYEVWQAVVSVGRVTLFGSLIVPAAVMAHRYRRAGPEQRAQIRWLMWAAIVSVLIVGLTLRLTGIWGELPLTLIVALNCAAIAIAVTRHRLYDIDRLLPTTLVYATLIGTFLLADLIVIAVAGSLLDGQDAALLAMALVAILYTACRDWLWRWARRLLLGIRPDAQRAIAILARQLELAATPEEQLRNLAHTVARELRLSYVLVVVERGTGERISVAHGQPTAHQVDLPVAYRGRRIGRLILGTRRGGRLSAGDQALLGDLVRQAAAAAQATDEAASLRRTRVQLVTAREEERRRLRRDLHDGLGPTIAAAAMHVKAARSVAGQSVEADRLLGASVDALSTLMEDVRRLVYNMRPPALDELGLVGALTPQLDTLCYADVLVTVDVPDSAPRLPAACEVAAYRILVEALTNVSRHAAARRCHISIHAGPDPADPTAKVHTLEVVVRDDGRGIPDSPTTGVGLLSMRERAAELGGFCDVAKAPGGGTQVRSLLPYDAQPAEDPVHA
ncbi:histidine kinase [Plantactinospora solaniradicis]|uniref:Oxygen sensor histidine kinase NreB n=1 Tax=Plantactinospora solaniradicis TaxID=1723736 RepID=A0ABW1KPT2_9ACTN